MLTSKKDATLSIPQSKPKNRLLNRMSAIILASIIITWMYYFITTWDPGRTEREKLIVPETIYLMIVTGLFTEAWRPSLDFTFDEDRRWISIGAILFAVFILINVHFWVAYGIVDWLPQYGWSKTIMEYVTRTLVMETSSL